MRRIGALAVVSVALAGCHTPDHTNTLLFATSTSVAVDVSGNPTTGAPHILVGYKREEGAFMPLLANGGTNPDGTKPAKCGEGQGDGKADDKCFFDGTQGQDKDTYSVIATFGGNTSTTAGQSSAVSGGIAQFFATGWAARKLAESGASLVNAASPPKAADQTPPAVAAPAVPAAKVGGQ